MYTITLLFNIFISDLGVALNSETGIYLGDKTISGLLFADDLIILGCSVQEFQEKLDVTQNWCRENKMETSILDVYALTCLQNKPKNLHESISCRYNLYLLSCKIWKL